MTAGAVSLQGLVKRYDDVRAVDGLDLEIRAGEFFSLLGESGCGKTTTLRMIAGFEEPDEGRVVVDGEDLTRVSAHRRPVNTVFQSYALFPFLTVRDNVGFGLRYAEVDKAAAAARIGEALDLVEMGALASRKPHQLSGGQQQRVALARALVLRPRVLLLDEPLGALDARLRKQLQRDLRALHQRVRTTFVYVTHDQEEALTMSDRLAVIVDGRVEQVGTPSEVYAAPATPYVASFLGSATLWQAEVVSASDEGVRCRVAGQDLLTAPADVAAGRTVTVMVRPERVELRLPGPAAAAPDDGNVLAGRVRRMTFQGAHTLVSVEHDGLVVDAQVANVHGEPPPWLAEGEDVCVRISPSALRVLP
ncbi:MAG TPA: ABC transporter ATP-binding protein [Nocardioides sp.]|uniref:ABC transporter ATP-binding protein n=1 Tax=Nocardioides sp. TaxID=35761 RepID=UPI002CB6AEFC|nr:ABC transporter ATP-binding protein [Nocardioides sp.]HQR26252.1 ABC transporter ATP-binding protein [Nocardioides sp.]